MDTNLCHLCEYKCDAATRLTVEELDMLNSSCARVNFKPGEIVVKQNALSTNVVYIKTGLVKMHVTDGTKEKVMKIVKAPSYLCLPSNFSDRVNNFSATALEETSVCFFDLTVFRNFIYTNGDFAYQIITDLSTSELKNSHVLNNNTQKNTMGRIATLLLYFSKEVYSNSTFVLPVRRQELGEIAGTTRESASRILSELHNEKIIDIDGKKIIILNDKLLEQISLNG